LSQKNESTRRAGKPNTPSGGHDQMHAHIGICSCKIEMMIRSCRGVYIYTSQSVAYKVSILEELGISV